MKKIVGLVLVALLAIGAGVFWYQSKINEAITSKINELNSNGFAVKNEQSTNYIKTSAKGEIEIVNPDKAVSYILADLKREELKKALELQYNLLNSNDKSIFLEGVKLDYDFVFENFNGKFNSNIYLTNLSKKVMYNLSNETDNESSKWLLNFLKDKKLQVSINEKKEYKVADIDTVIPDGVFATIKGWSGNEKNLAISTFKISGTGVSEKEFLLLNNLNVDFDVTENKESSKTTIASIEFQADENFLNIKNLFMNSVYEKNDKLMNTQSEVGFDEVAVKVSNVDTINIKKSFFKFNLNNLPVKTVEEFTQYVKELKYDEYLKALSQNGTTIQSTGNASNYIIKGQKIFDTLKFDLSLGLNKNGTILDAKKVNDIVDNAKVTIDLDKETAQNAKALFAFMPNGAEVDFTDTSDNLKRIEAVLKNDGVYINNKKIVEESELVLPNNEEQAIDNTPIQKINQKNLTYTYKMIDENLLKLDVKYNTSLKVVSSGGISVSFPQFIDASRIIKNESTSFKDINFYNAGTEIWNGGLQQNVVSSYLLAEGWDENWKNNEEQKSISLIIDVSGLSSLEVNLRAGALNEIDSLQSPSEIVPTVGALDQQNYPVEIIEIPLFRAK